MGGDQRRIVGMVEWILRLHYAELADCLDPISTPEVEGGERVARHGFLRIGREHRLIARNRPWIVAECLIPLRLREGRKRRWCAMAVAEGERQKARAIASLGSHAAKDEIGAEER